LVTRGIIAKRPEEVNPIDTLRVDPFDALRVDPGKRGQEP
jgi:hypothetical protein